MDGFLFILGQSEGLCIKAAQLFGVEEAGSLENKLAGG